MARKKRKEGDPTYDERNNRTKKPVGLRLSEDLLERLRNAVFWIGQGMTVNGLVEDAITKAVAGLEADHNHGKPFKPRTNVLPRGKPEG